MTETDRITERLLSGDRSALARLITWAENGDLRFPPALARIFGRLGRSRRVGITGPPGAGKSTLVNELAKLERAAGRTVGIVAVDPTSPISGGALLGDRIRMEERTLDPGVFIRSMASRDGRGGLARAAIDACDVMDAFGFDLILLETVGVGQAEFDVVRAADTVVVVLCPGAGDEVQAMKAGLLEVADVLVVNKSDLAGADRLAADLEDAVHQRFLRRSGTWTPPVVSCSTVSGSGIADVRSGMEAHRAYLGTELLESMRRRKRLEQVQQMVNDHLCSRLWASPSFMESARRGLESRTTPYAVADAILEPILALIPYPGSRAADGGDPS